MVEPRTDEKRLPVAGIPGRSPLWVPDMTHSMTAHSLSGKSASQFIFEVETGSLVGRVHDSLFHTSSARKLSLNQTPVVTVTGKAFFDVGHFSQRSKN